MDKLSIAKAAAELVVTMSVSSVVGTVVKSTISPEMKPIRRIGTIIGASVLAGAASAAAWDYTEKQINTIVTATTAIKDTVQTVKDVVIDKDDPTIITVERPDTDISKGE